MKKKNSGYPREFYHRFMYIAPSTDHSLIILNLPFQVILSKFEVVFWCLEWEWYTFQKIYENSFESINTVEPRYNEVLGTMKITLLYQVSHYIRVKKLRNIKSWDQQNYLVTRGFCYIRPRYNEVPLYYTMAFTYEVYLEVSFLVLGSSLVIGDLISGRHTPPLHSQFLGDISHWPFLVGSLDGPSLLTAEDEEGRPVDHQGRREIGRNSQKFFSCNYIDRVELHYNEDLVTMKITLLYQGEKRNVKSWDQQNFLVIRGFCYIRPLYKV